MISRKDLFDFMIRRIQDTADENADLMPQAFGRWFSRMYFPGISNITISDGAGDGKVDLIVTCQVGRAIKTHILNTKFTASYDKASPVAFYDEITRYWQAFENKANRGDYLEGVVRPNLRDHYKKLFKLYDEGDAQLYFVTNHKANPAQQRAVRNYGVTLLHLDDLLQYVAEHIEGAMPETDPLLLSGITNVLTPATNETEVPTSIVFARLVDFIKYMEDDPFDLLFARNVRLWLGATETNKEIQRTFNDSPKEFAYSNNGITILCKKHTHDPGKQELRLENPRVVNGSQTLHSVKRVETPSSLARVMVRIIEVPQTSGHDLPSKIAKRKEIVHKISVRSNLQNPIRRWNLVSNDDFQNGLSQFFWTKKLFYERRQHEWRERKLQLRSIRIEKGPDLRWMTQLIAAYHFDKKGLGPADAYARLGDLFGEGPYGTIIGTSAEVAYQLYLLAEILDECLKKLAANKVYIRNLRGYAELTLVSLMAKIFRNSGIRLGSEGYEKYLEAQVDDPCSDWTPAIKHLIDYVDDHYKRLAATEWRTNRKKLLIPNYFKNATMIRELTDRPIPNRIAKQLLLAMKDH